jgi:hypothetical protein
MSEAQDQMKKALKDVVVPRLRDHDFTGAFPHFRRRRSDRIDLLTFQFDRHGGGFIIEIGQCPAEGFTNHWGKLIGPEKVKAWDLSSQQRARIQPRIGSGTDSWFRYDGTTARDVFNLQSNSLQVLRAQPSRNAEFEDCPFVTQLRGVKADFTNYLLKNKKHLTRNVTDRVRR